MPRLHGVPFPCMVYTRDSAGAVYRFSHACPMHIPKSLPRSLRVQDLQEFKQRSGEFTRGLMNTAFLVLVAGDRAQCVSVANMREKRIPFLFRGSCYERRLERLAKCSEIEEGYVSMYFYSTLTTFSRGSRPGVMPLENGLILFPKMLRERDIPRLGKWVRHHVEKAIHQSMWVVDEVAYNEHSLAISSKKLTWQEDQTMSEQHETRPEAS
jgi:hypothetical protein